MVPIGVIINSFAIITGGIIGGFLGNKVPLQFKQQMNLIFGVCSMAMGIMSIAPMKYMPAVIFSVVVGTALGLAIHLGEKITQGALLLQRPIAKIVPQGLIEMSQEDFLNSLVTIIVLFCASGTGIYGSLAEGMTGDSSILISKSILDFFTALIFACNLGYVVAAIAVPQLVIFSVIYYLAQVIYPLTTPDMILDFKAAGGILMVATGFRIIQVKLFPTGDMILAMLLVMPVSWAWANWILPLL
ncbi:MAG: DUF554 domain-containing protein [Enterococcus sp.]